MNYRKKAFKAKFTGVGRGLNVKHAQVILEDVSKALLILVALFIAHPVVGEVFEKSMMPCRADWQYMESVSAEDHLTRHLLLY